MDDFLKNIKISFKVDEQDVSKLKQVLNNLQKNADFEPIKVDESSIKSLKKLIGAMDDAVNSAKSLKDFGDFVKSGVIDEKTAKNLQSQLDRLDEIEKEIDKTTKLIDEVSKLQTDSSEETVKKLQKHLDDLENERESIIKDDTMATGKAKLAAWGLKQLQKIGEEFIKGVKKTFEDAMNEFDKILSYSQLTNEQVRSTAFQYGLSSSENYAYQKTLGFMGFSDLEDLFYANKQQQNKFQEKMLEYQERYNKLYDSGFFEQYQDFQWEMKEFKEDLTYEVMNFIMDNKETLKDLMHAVVKISEFLIKSLGWLVERFGGRSDRSDSEKLAAASDIVNNNSSNTSSTNVKIDNTFNNVDSKDRTWLANAGSMTYEQIIRALT